MLKTTKITDPELYSIVEKELERQKYNIEMIASESSAPTEILELMGSVFVNKTEEISKIDWKGFIPYLAGLTTCIALHFWKRNSLLSIFAATIIYMILIRIL